MTVTWWASCDIWVSIQAPGSLQPINIGSGRWSNPMDKTAKFDRWFQLVSYVSCFKWFDLTCWIILTADVRFLVQLDSVRPWKIQHDSTFTSEVCLTYFLYQACSIYLLTLGHTVLSWCCGNRGAHLVFPVNMVIVEQEWTRIWFAVCHKEISRSMNYKQLYISNWRSVNRSSMTSSPRSGAWGIAS